MALVVGIIAVVLFIFMIWCIIRVCAKADEIEGRSINDSMVD